MKASYFWPPQEHAISHIIVSETAVMVGSKTNQESSRIWHKTQLRVPLFEVDLGQAVYHGNYFHLFELGREAFLRDLGYPYRRFMDQQLHLKEVNVLLQ